MRDATLQPDEEAVGLDDLTQLAADYAAQLKFERLIADLAARFNSLGEDQLDGEIEHWLRRLVEILDVDRSSFAELRGNGVFQVTHSYAVPGLDPYPKTVANDKLPWLVGELAAGRTVIVSRIPDDIPLEAGYDRAYFTGSGMRAGIAIPAFIDHHLICVLTFGAFRAERTWSEQVVSRLRLTADIIANAVARRQAKHRLQEKQHELAHVGRVAVMAELASVIAHELDQPLTAVVSNAQAVRYMLGGEKPDLVEVDQALGDVIDAALRVTEIIRRERMLLRKSPERMAEVDLNALIREIELFIRADARHNGASVAMELAEGLPPVHADGVQLQQVILNLSRNGLQAMSAQAPADRKLRIATAGRSGEIVLEVADSGPPIADADFSRMFEPFYTTKPGGLGMGLSISRSIVENHGGRIWASRNQTGGLTVHVAVPMAER